VWASAGEIGHVLASLWSGLLLSCAVLCRLRACIGRRGAGAVSHPWRTKSCVSKSSLSAGIDTSQAGGPEAHDEAHLCAPRGAPGQARVRGDKPSWLARGGADLREHAAQGVGGDRTAGMEQADVTAFHEARRVHVVEDPAEKCDGVEGGGAGACTARWTGGQGDGAVCESDQTSVGDGDPEARGGEGGEGRMASGTGLRGDMPGDLPALWGDVLQQSGSAQVFFEAGAVDRREGFDGDAEGGSGGEPGGAVLGASPARDARGDVGRVRELPAPGRQDAGETGEVRTDATRIFGEACEGERRGGAQGLW
jgi:hypothetical protein